MIDLYSPLGFVVARDQAQIGPASRLHRRRILPVGGGTTNLGPSRDERHLMLVCHDGTTWSCTFFIAAKQVFEQPPFGVSASARPAGCPDQLTSMRISAAVPLIADNSQCDTVAPITVAEASSWSSMSPSFRLMTRAQGGRWRIPHLGEIPCRKGTPVRAMQSDPTQQQSRGHRERVDCARCAGC